MNVVIMRPFDCDTDGIVEYSSFCGKLKVSYTLNRKNTDDSAIYKLLLMSSAKPFNPPVIVHTPEFRGECAWGERNIDESTLAYSGYYADDADTFALVRKDSHIIASAGFGKLSWDISSSIMSDAEKDHTLLRAEQVLKSNRQPMDEEGYNLTLSIVDKFRKSLSDETTGPLDSFEWYVADKEVPQISSFVHVLSPVKKTGENGKGLIVGFSGSTDIAFAVESQENPFENTEDCSIFENGYWISAVRLAPDGQYFLRPDIKVIPVGV